ncbi:MAG: nucleotidyl transferase AbiEii/AbiGii toxin family protein [Elusimicrobiota bacterium]
MKVSKERLLAQATSSGFRPEVLEKAVLLLGLLEGLGRHPFLKGKLALKGGTALNLFLFDVPRLSVDADLNYVGAAGREAMLADRPKVERAVEAVCSREGFAVRRSPEEHAGGKWSLRYPSAMGGGGNLELDVNYLFRVPLWPVALRSSKSIGGHKAKAALLDPHELAAGKLAALLARGASRDLFDAHQLLTKKKLDRAKLRLAFVVYGAIDRKDWREVSAKDVSCDPREAKNQLIPLLRKGAEGWKSADVLVRECRKGLKAVLPFTKSEMEFLDRLLDRGEIEPSLITKDKALAERIRAHPGLQWKALNVKQFKGKRLSGPPGEER